MLRTDSTYHIEDVLLVDEEHPLPVYPTAFTHPTTPIIFEDTRQHDGHHTIKHECFDELGVYRVVHRLRFGDYAADGVPIVIDTKRNVEELEQTVVAEINDPRKSARPAWIEARQAGYQFIILVETDDYTYTDDLITWLNPVCYERCPWYDGYMCNPADRNTPCPRFKRNYHPADAARLLRGIWEAEQEYGVKFLYCSPYKAASTIYEILIGKKF